MKRRDEDHFSIWNTGSTTYVRMPLIAFIGGGVPAAFDIALARKLATTAGVASRQRRVQRLGFVLRPGMAAASGDVDVAGFLQAMPDLEVTVHDAFAAGDRVVGRYSYTGTFTGPLLGNAPTGQRVTMTSIDIWRVEDGRFVEHWDEINSLELFVQLGAVAAPGSEES